MRSFALPPDCQQLVIRPWHDAVVDGVGHDLRSRYVERFWISLLGPTSTWFLRYLADHFEVAADEFVLDLVSCSAAIGLGRSIGRTSAMNKTIGRCCAFKVTRMVNRRTLEVRQRLAPLSSRQVKQLPELLRDEHAQWIHDHTDPAKVAALTVHAQRMALSLFGIGENVESTEQQLQRWRFPSAIAQAAAAWADARWTGKPVPAPL
jgi:hypothetical protein